MLKYMGMNNHDICNLLSDTQTHMYVHTSIHIYMCINIHVYACEAKW